MSYNVTLNISDSVYKELMLTLSSFSNDEVEIISNEMIEEDSEITEEYLMKYVPPSLIVTSEEEVNTRLAKAEESLANGGGLTEEEYEKEMAKFMEKLLSENN